MKKAISFISAMALTLSSIGGIQAFAADTSKLPDWVPDSHEEADEFYNTYGSTRIQDGLICIALPKADNREYNISAKTDTASELSRKSFSPSYNSCDIEIVVYEPSKDCNLEIEVTESFKGKEERIQNYTFEIDEKGNITETDIFSFLPDCNTEFEDFIKKYGTASVHGEYIVYAPQIGYDFMCDYIMNQDGTAELEEVAVVDILRGLKKFIGDNTDTIFLYTPVSEGVVDVNWIVSEEYINGDETGIYTQSDIKRKFEIDENGKIKDITAELITGDLNKDGKVDNTTAFWDMWSKIVREYGTNGGVYFENESFACAGRHSEPFQSDSGAGRSAADAVCTAVRGGTDHQRYAGGPVQSAEVHDGRSDRLRAAEPDILVRAVLYDADGVIRIDVGSGHE